MAVYWVLRDPKYYLISVEKTTLRTSIYRKRYRTVQSSTSMVCIEITILEVCKNNYSVFSQKEQQNVCRLDDLNFEKKFRTQSSTIRVNTALFDTVIVDGSIIYI